MSKLWGESQQEMSMLENNKNFMTYFLYFKLLCVSLFKWEGLPSGATSEFVEENLFKNGFLIYCEDDSIGGVIAKATIGSELNMYDNPLGYQTYSINFTKSFNADEVEVLRNNTLKISTWFIVKTFAERIGNINTTLDINTITMRTPVMFTGTDKIRFSLKQLWAKIIGGEPAIFTNKAFEKGCMEKLDLTTPNNINSLIDYKNELKNEFLTFIGINNSNTDKRERLNADEVNSNNQQIQTFYDSMLKERQEFCKRVNARFGTNISVIETYERGDGEYVELYDND